MNHEPATPNEGRENSMNGHQTIPSMEEKILPRVIVDLEKMTVRFPLGAKGEGNYLSRIENKALLRKARAEAFEEALKTVDEWRDLLEINHRKIIADMGYSDPQEASREYRNQDNLLGAVSHALKRKAREGK